MPDRVNRCCLLAQGRTNSFGNNGAVRMIQTEHELLESLSDKQRQALDLLILHKTSKEISRILGISHHTVDQRIEGAKRKLGASSRSELANTYRHLISVCHQMTYEDSPIAFSRVGSEPPDRFDPEHLLIQLEPERETKPVPEWINRDLRVLPWLFDGRWGVIARLGAVALIAFLFVISVLGGIAIFEVASDLFAKSN